MHPDSFSSCGDNSGSTQVSEMAANFRLIRFEYLDKETDADFLISDEIDDPQTS